MARGGGSDARVSRWRGGGDQFPRKHLLLATVQHTAIDHKMVMDVCHTIVQHHLRRNDRFIISLSLYISLCQYNDIGGC